MKERFRFQAPPCLAIANDGAGGAGNSPDLAQCAAKPKGSLASLAGDIQFVGTRAGWIYSLLERRQQIDAGKETPFGFREAARSVTEKVSSAMAGLTGFISDTDASGRVGNVLTSSY